MTATADIEGAIALRHRADTLRQLAARLDRGPFHALPGLADENTWLGPAPAAHHRRLVALAAGLRTGADELRGAAAALDARAALVG